MARDNYGDTLVLFQGTTAAGGQTVNGNWITAASCGALRRAREIVFVLDVTATLTDAGDTLDVKIQEGVPGSVGPIANDRVHFTQVLGNGGAKTYIAKIITPVAVAATGAPSTALAASLVVDGPLPDQIRYVATIVDANSNSAFTFSLKAYIKA